MSAQVGKIVYYGAIAQANGTGKNTAACLAIDKGNASPSCAGHCGNTVQDCGEAGLNCGGECPVCPDPTQYVYADCKSGEAPSNGSEDCDDTTLNVQPPGTQYALVCFSHAGGVAYLASNTPPTQADGAARCQGWEEKGQSAADFLEYIIKTTCDADQKTVALDLTAFVGKQVRMGTHTNPDGSGHGTVACVALKK